MLSSHLRTFSHWLLKGFFSPSLHFSAFRSIWIPFSSFHIKHIFPFQPLLDPSVFKYLINPVVSVVPSTVQCVVYFSLSNRLFFFLSMRLKDIFFLSFSLTPFALDVFASVFNNLACCVYVRFLRILSNVFPVQVCLLPLLCLLPNFPISDFLPATHNTFQRSFPAPAA
jgi:hypothetical protein